MMMFRIMKCVQLGLFIFGIIFSIYLDVCVFVYFFYGSWELWINLLLG